MAQKRKIQTKGVRYIAEKLNKYFGKKYPTKKGALPQAKEILSKLKANGEKVTIKNISNIVRVKRGSTPKKGEAPKIYRELASPVEYFLLADYPNWIQRTTNEVWFDSKISPEGLPMIQGGSVVEYQEYFKPFVDYINGMISLEEGNEDLYQTEYFVVCTEPNIRNANKRWESQIIAIGNDGIPYNFGFDSKNPDKMPTMVETTPDGRVGTKWNEKVQQEEKKPQKRGRKPKEGTEPKPKSPKKPKTKPKGKSKTKPDSDAKSKVELKRLQLIEKIYDMFLQGKITKEEMQKMVAKYE